METRVRDTCAQVGEREATEVGNKSKEKEAKERECVLLPPSAGCLDLTSPFTAPK